MSLVADPDYVLRVLQLQYLRRLPDPLGPSTITFPPSFSPYLEIGGLNNSTLWPELNMVRAPKAVGSERIPGVGGLKYSETIVGKNGGFSAGMRVRGRRRTFNMGRGGRKGQQGPGELKPVNEHDEQGQTHDEEASSDEDGLESRLQLQPPTVTVQSPQRSPTTPQQHSSHARTLSADQTTPNALRILSEQQHSIQDVLAETDAANLQNNTQARSRPVTLMPEYSHDKELSDALLWEEGDQYPQPAQLDAVPESPSTSPQDHSETSTVDTQPRMMAQSNQDPSPFSYSDALSSRGTSFNLANASTSIMEGTSEPALQSRRAGRLQRGPSEPELAKIKDPTPSLHPKAPEQAEREAQMPLPTGSIVPLRPAGAPPRRERRRVNISAGMLLVNPPAPNQTQSPTAAPHSPRPTEATAESPSSVKRERAGTDPSPAKSVPSPTIRRQTSSDAQPPSPASLAKHPSQSSLRQQQQPSPTGQVPGRTSPLRPLTLLTPRSSDERAALLRSKPPSPAQLSFTKEPVASTSATAKSSLSSMIAQTDAQATQVNPFMYHYGALICRGDVSGLDLKLFFPNNLVKVKVKNDVTAEETIGCGLLKYWEAGLQPPLLSDEEKEAWDGESLQGKLDPARWNLHIVEDEDSGEVDDDFPALDRTKAISAFSFNAFAIVPASAASYQTNLAIQAQIHRRPSRLIGRPSANNLKIQTSPDPTAAASPTSPLAPSDKSRLDVYQSDEVSTSLLADKTPAATGASAHAEPGGKEVLLRVRIPVPGLESVVSTVKVTTKTYLADVVETICKKRKDHLGDAKNWVLMLGDRDIIAPTDRTVESLQGSYNLRLVKKSEVSGYLKATQNRQLANTNPDASIFKRLSEPAQPKYVSASDITSQNKRWRVFRKHAMSLTKHERILSIEGDTLQFLHPSGQPGRTPPYHISQVMGAKPSKRVDNGFKLFFYLDREVKRYDLEAQEPKDIAEIIAAIEQAKSRWKALGAR